MDAVLAVHEPAKPGRAQQRQQIGQEQVRVFHPPFTGYGVPGQIVQKPVGERAGPGRRLAVVHPELSGCSEPGGPDARTHGRTAARVNDDGEWRRWRRRCGRSGGRCCRGLVPWTAPRAITHPQGAPGDHGQAAQGRGGRGDHE